MRRYGPNTRAGNAPTAPVSDTPPTHAADVTGQAKFPTRLRTPQDLLKRGIPTPARTTGASGPVPTSPGSTQPPGSTRQCFARRLHRQSSCLAQVLGTRMTCSPAEARKTGTSRTKMRSYSAMSGGRSAKGTRYGVIFRSGSLGPERQPACTALADPAVVLGDREPFDFLVAEREIRCTPVP